MHAAHERVSYNKIRNLIKSRKVISQPLLLPISIELSEKAIDNILENSEILSDFGFEIDRIGINNVIIRAIPNYYIDQEVLSFFKEIASYDDSFSADGAVERKIDYIAARLACHASIRSGKELEKEDLNESESNKTKEDFTSVDPKLAQIYQKTLVQTTPTPAPKRNLLFNYSKVTNEEIGNSAIIGINKTIKTKLRENLIDKDFGFISKIEGGLTTIDQTSNSSTELPQTPPNLDELKEYSNSSKLLSFYDWKSYKSPKWQ
jgi:hypothetical protein